MIKSKAVVAAAQMVSGDDVRANLEQARGLLQLAKEEHDADLLVLPENFALFSAKQYLDFAYNEAKQPYVVDFLQQEAQRHQLWICAGTLPLLPSDVSDPSTTASTSTPSRVRSASLIINDAGDIVARYDKIHLFDVSVADAQGGYSESTHIEPGIEPMTCPTPVGLLGLSVCYDLRFPELYRHYAEKGVTMVLAPSAFTAVTGAAHWELLLRARAVENQVYVVGANQGGRHSEKRETWGHSMIVDPWGEVVSQLSTGVGVTSAVIDAEFQKKVRASMPVLQHRRLS